MSLISGAVNLIVMGSLPCAIANSTSAGTFAITNKNFLCSRCNFVNSDNRKLLQQLKSSFRKTINWRKYQSKVSMQPQNKYLN